MQQHDFFMNAVMELPTDVEVCECALCNEIICYKHEGTFYDNWGIELVDVPNVVIVGEDYFLRKKAGDYLCDNCIANFEPTHYAKVYSNWCEVTFFFDDNISKLHEETHSGLDIADYADTLDDVLAGREFVAMKKGWVKESDREEWVDYMDFVGSIIDTYVFLTKKHPKGYYSAVWVNYEDVEYVDSIVNGE